MLKALYSESSEPEAIASEVGLSVKETKKRISELEAKVRLYLAGERLTLPQAQAASTRHAATRSLQS